MSIPDEPMRQYFTLLTDLPLEEVDRLLAPGVNPRDAKEVLGKAIVGAVSRRRGRRAAAAEFRRRAAGEDPDGDPRRRRSTPSKLDAEGRIAGVRLLVALGLESSTSNARRVIEQGGVTIGPDRQADHRPQGPDRGRRTA